MDFWGCAWQTQPTEKEFKGIVLAAGEESREGRGEQTASQEEEMTYSQSVISASRYKTFEVVTAHLQEAAQTDSYFCTVCVVH